MRGNRLWGYNWVRKATPVFGFARCARNESRVAAHAPEMESMDRFYATVLATAPSANVHLNIAWLPSDYKIYVAKRAAAKAQRLFIKLRSYAHCGSEASHDPLFSL